MTKQFNPHSPDCKLDADKPIDEKGDDALIDNMVATLITSKKSPHDLIKLFVDRVRQHDKGSEWISVEKVLGDFSFTRDINHQKIIVGQSDGSGVVVEDNPKTSSIAENILYRLADHLINSLPSPPQEN